jgi:hypothetical protein
VKCSFTKPGSVSHLFGGDKSKVSYAQRDHRRRSPLLKSIFNLQESFLLQSSLGCDTSYGAYQKKNVGMKKISISSALVASSFSVQIGF